MKRLKLPSCFSVRVRQHFPVRRDGCLRRSQRSSLTSSASLQKFHQGILSPGATIHTRHPSHLRRMYRWESPAAASRRCLRLSRCIPAMILNYLSPPPLLAPVGPDRTTRRPNVVPQVPASPDPEPRIRQVARIHAGAIGLATRHGEGSDKRTAQKIWPATRHGAGRTERTITQNFKLNVRNVRLSVKSAKPNDTQTERRPCRSPR